MSTETLHKLPLPPPEVPAEHTVIGLAPKFYDALRAVLVDLVGSGWRPTLRETLRSNARAEFLFKFGREYDDGRGVVTDAPNALRTWHHYGLAADIGDKRYEAGAEPQEFRTALGRSARAHGLAWGGDWKMNDWAHVQWHCDGMHVSPSDHAAALLQTQGVEAVWRELHAA